MDQSRRLKGFVVGGYRHAAQGQVANIVIDHLEKLIEIICLFPFLAGTVVHIIPCHCFTLPDERLE